LNLDEQYVGVDKHDSITRKDECKDCTWPPCPAKETCQDKCWAVDHKKYYAKNFYSVRGADAMKAEIYKNGPIGCGVDATAAFDKYTGGIYSERIMLP